MVMEQNEKFMNEWIVIIRNVSTLIKIVDPKGRFVFIEALFEELD